MITILIDLDNTLYPKKYADELAKEMGFDSFDNCSGDIKDYIISKLYSTLKIPEYSIIESIPRDPNRIVYIVSKICSTHRMVAFFSLIQKLKSETARNIVPIPDISRKQTFEILCPDITIHDYDEDIDEYCNSDLIFRVKNYIIEETKRGEFISELKTPSKFSFYQLLQSHSFARVINSYCGKKEEETTCSKGL